MEQHISEVFGEGLLSSVYFVDSNPATIETVEIRKDGDRISETVTESEFRLRRVSIKKSGNIALSIRSAVKHEFMKSIRFASDRKEVRYFKRGIRGLFSRRNPKTLAREIEGYDWAIMSRQMIDELSVLEEYEPVAGHGDIRLKGKIGGASIFLCEEAEGIFLGMKESVSAAFLRGISEDERDPSIGYVELQMKCFGGMKKIWIH